MTVSPTSFLDPSIYPVVFEPETRAEIVLNLNQFDVAFGFNPLPRTAYINTLAVKQKNAYLIDRTIYGSASVVEFVEGVTHRIKLKADSRDFQNAILYLSVQNPGVSDLVVEGGGIAHIRQPKSATDVLHSFQMDVSTQLFDPVSSYYPTVSLDLEFYPHLDDSEYAFSNLSLPDKTNTLVTLAPANSSGILDIVATVHARWYTDEARTSLYNGTPPVALPTQKFGLRVYVSTAGLFVKNVQLLESGSAIVSGLYPSSVLRSMHVSNVDCFYFGGTINAADLFASEALSVEVSDSGLPIQDDVETGVYLFTNLLSA